MPRIDPIGSGQVFISDSDAAINAGLAYFYSDFVTVAASGVLITTIQVGAKNLHFLYEITSSQFGFSYVAYENVAANDDGTVVTPINHNRCYPDASVTVLRLNPTGLDKTGSTLIRRGYSGTAINPAKGEGGSASLNRKVILKANIKYSLEMTNLSTSATNDLMLNVGWDEL